jgi:hypothetical protein
VLLHSVGRSDGSSGGRGARIVPAEKERERTQERPAGLVGEVDVAPGSSSPARGGSDRALAGAAPGSSSPMWR